jgi:hypothetical protein
MMHRLSISLVLAVFAIPILNGQDLDKILNDHYKATGQEKLSNVTSIALKGKINIAAMGMESAISLYQARPNKLRIEVLLAGSKMIQTYNGTTGWMYAPLFGITQPQEVGAAELKGLTNQAQMDSPLWNYKAKGSTVELIGSSEDGSNNLVKLTTAEGDALTFSISKETSLISKILTFQGGTEIETDMKQYKTVKGIPTAHYIATKMSGVTATTITIESIEYDTKMEPALFEKPVVE